MHILAKRTAHWVVIAIALLVGAEIAVRAATNTLFVLDPGVNDPIVGRVPKPGVSIRHPTKWYRMTTDADGTRWNGPHQLLNADRPLTLAVGDSFTFGEEVNDDQTWPAILEHILGRRVINGGVGGFGLDQSVLRTEQLTGVYHPDTIIVSFIADDVRRTEWSREVRSKPYFDIVEGRLRFHPAPLPERSLMQRVLQVSLITHSIFQRYVDSDGPAYIRVHQQGKEVSCLLMQRLRDLSRAHATRVVVLAQPDAIEVSTEDVAVKNHVLACAVANQLPTLDLFPRMEALPLAQRQRLFFENHGHMTEGGNRWVATEISSFLLKDSGNASESRIAVP